LSVDVLHLQEEASAQKAARNDLQKQVDELRARIDQLQSNNSPKK
jgi:cell division protein FtsB